MRESSIITRAGMSPQTPNNDRPLFIELHDNLAPISKPRAGPIRSVDQRGNPC
jgi:hypothetical protein